jgi:hypothetical protein
MTTEEQYTTIIRGLTSGEIDFDMEVHGQDQALLDQIAESSSSAFKKIPVELITEKMKDMSIVNICIMHAEEQCHVKNDYEQSAINLMGMGAHISSFHRDLLTEKIAHCALEYNISSTLTFRDQLNESQKALFTPDMLKYAFENAPETVKKLSREEVEQIGDETLLSVFMKAQVFAYSLFQIGKPKLFSQVVAAGAWMYPGVFNENPRPSDLGETIRKRMKLENFMHKEIAYYNAYIASHPLIDVAPLMKSTARRKVLLEIFPAQELLQVFKDDREMKGLILEEEMGL